jgi:hypothetical protein
LPTAPKNTAPASDRKVSFSAGRLLNAGPNSQ